MEKIDSVENMYVRVQVKIPKKYAKLFQALCLFSDRTGCACFCDMLDRESDGYPMLKSMSGFGGGWQAEEDLPQDPVPEEEISEEAEEAGESGEGA